MAVTQQQLASCIDVTVAYGFGAGSVTALAGVDFAVAAGEQIAVMGKSGSGKTTVLHVLGGLVVPTSGAVLWHGEPLASLDEAAQGRVRAAGIAYVFQGSNLLPHLTAFENVAFASWMSADGPPGEDAFDPAGLLALVGLKDKLDALPSELSGGEAQRVAIARALAQRPQLLLCDEPTGHLDTDTGRRVLDLLDALQERFGFAVVTATHDPEVAARASRTVTLVDGRVALDVEEGRAL